MDRPSAKAKMRILSCGAACQLRVNHCQAQCRTDIKRRAAVRPSVCLSVPCPLLKKMRFTATPMTTAEHQQETPCLIGVKPNDQRAYMRHVIGTTVDAAHDMLRNITSN